MDKTINRENYIKEFRDFLKLVNIDENVPKPNFMSLLRGQQCFEHHWNNIDQAESDETKKYYIFLELTRDRGMCEIIIELLNDSNQVKAAQKLFDFNKSLVIIDILKCATRSDIQVSKRSTAKEGLYPSNSYPMFNKPRGKFIIINNIRTEIFRESVRFEHIFRELSFEVVIKDCLNIKQIQQLLREIAMDVSLDKDQAFGLMIISHGGDERILGFDACQQLTKNEQKNQRIIDEDQIEFCQLVQIITPTPALHKKPKIFIFNCCRIKRENSLNYSNYNIRQVYDKCIETLVEQMECDSEMTEEDNKKIRGNWVNENENTDTFIIHSCSEGCYSYYSIYDGISLFGQSLSHAIAYYAIDESLQSIMCRTCNFMEKFREILVNKKYFGETAYSKPESKYQCVGKNLLFNPGFNRTN